MGILNKDLGVFILLVVLIAVGGMLSIAYGPWHISPGDILKVLLNKSRLFAYPVGDVETTIIWDGRMPRLLVAFFVGMALSAAGVIMQGIFKNPMASPDIIGISSGAAFGAVTAIYLGFAALSVLIVPLFAVAFALAALVTVFIIATSRGHTSISTLLLAGIALGLIFGALTSFIITLSTKEFDVGRVIVTWLMGDLNNRTWEHVWIVFPAVVAGYAGAYFFVRDLNILMISEETATTLGVHVSRARNGLLFFAALLTGASIAVSGVIGFVGLLAPHIMRSIVGPDNRKLLLFAGLLGAVLIIYSDLFVRLVITVDLRIGILTSLMGGPFFIYLIIKHKKRFEYF